MIIDCERCTMRGPACADCVVTHFLALEPIGRSVPEQLGAPEERALAVLHGAGLVPPLRMCDADVRATG